VVIVKAKLLLVLVLFSLLISLASANLEIVEQKAVLNVNYHDFQEDNQDTVDGTGQITLRNTGTENITTQIAFSGLPINYNATAIIGINVNAGRTQTVSYTIQVPHKQDSGEKNIGTLTATAGTETATTTLVQNTATMLNLREVTVDYINKDGNSERESFDSEDQYELNKEVKIGTEVKLTFYLENLFDVDYGRGDLQGITVTVDSDDSSIFSNDFQNDYDIGDLDTHQRNSFPVTFIIDSEADSQGYTLQIDIEGEDDKGTTHKVSKELLIDVNRQNDDVRISSSKITPAVPTTCDTQVTFEAGLKNYGTRDQKYAGFVLFNRELAINQNIQNIVVYRFSDSDNEWKQTFTIPISKVGTFPLDVTAYYNRDKVSDHQIVNLVVGRCATTVPATPAATTTTTANTTSGTPAATTAGTSTTTNAQTTNAAQNTAAQTNQNTAAPAATATNSNTPSIVKTIENPYTAEDFLLGGIIVLMVFVTTLGVIFMIMLLKK